MCGIGGIYLRRPGVAPSLDSLSRVAAALRHRGPDEFGVFRDARCGLSHSRLSIVDLETGQQPLEHVSGRLVISYNGEVFNHVELRQELEQLGQRFRTRSDTEVVLAAYDAWGDAAFARFNGQFAIAIWDRREQRLVLARDPAGIHPLHVCELSDRVLFASEVKGIYAADPALPRAFDPIGLEQTFTFWSIVPPQGLYQGIGEVEPGHVRSYQGDRVADHAFAGPEYPTRREDHFRGSLADATHAVSEALTRATRLRMVRADVPVGSYLSGGLDSSLVAAMGAGARSEPFRTFSLRFADAEYDETEYQREMVRHLGSEHAELMVTRDDIASAFADVVLHAERPVLRTAPAPMFLLSGLVRRAGIKVVLTGEGADEVFAGYDLFREAKVRRFWAKQPGSTCRPQLLDRLYPYLARSPVSQRAMARRFFGRNLEEWRLPGFSHQLRWGGTAVLKRLFSKAQEQAVGQRDVVAELLGSLTPAHQHWTHLARDQHLEIRTLLHGYLLSSQGDRMLMAHSVEGRFPFLDPDVMKLAASLPPDHLLHVLDEKHVLKLAARGRVPTSILSRKKQPYRAPDVLSFVAEPWASWVSELLRPQAVADAGVFEPGAVGALWEKCRARATEPQFSNTDNMALVGVLSTQLLHQRLILAHPEPAPVTLGTCLDRLEDP